jgi:ribosome-associated heat shock protein Hsp15
MESMRVDRWLWAVRLYRSRAAATEACRGGHVRINEAPAKPARTVRTGDRVQTRAGGRERVLEVVEPIGTRGSATEVAAAYVDHSPPIPPRGVDSLVPFREPSSGRPTKRDRRQLDRLRRS